jgi:hypothetical protein
MVWAMALDVPIALGASLAAAMAAAEMPPMTKPNATPPRTKLRRFNGYREIVIAAALPAQLGDPMSQNPTQSEKAAANAI